MIKVLWMCWSEYYGSGDLLACAPLQLFGLYTAAEGNRWSWGLWFGWWAAARRNGRESNSQSEFPTPGVMQCGRLLCVFTCTTSLQTKTPSPYERVVLCLVQEGEKDEKPFEGRTESQVCGS